MSTTQTIDQTDIICGLKAAVTALECYYNAQVLKEQKKKAVRKITSPTICRSIPTQDISVKKDKVRSKSICDTHILSNSIDSPLVKRNSEKVDRDRYQKTSRVIFPEMRGGILYTRCCCLHRDGLQDSCPLSQCQGQPECLVKPWAICPPGKLSRLRHPELYPKTSNTNCIT